ncbi:sensor histidine kinase [Streptomyces sp. NPDC090445]|uniref:sensor histidine kinase n=1 Tax=Streptomyces sp. NPDC090445 TaxID=3365963 RepID=UPI0038071E1B
MGDAAAQTSRPVRRTGPGPVTTVCLVALAATVLWVVLRFVDSGVPRLQRSGFSDFAAKELLCLGTVLFGALVMARSPARRLGWLLLLTPTAVLVSEAALATGAALGVSGTAAAVLIMGSILGEAVWDTTALSLPLWLPSGRLPGLPGRVLFAVCALWALAETWCAYAVRSPYGLASPLAGGGWADFTQWLWTFVGPVPYVHPLLPLVGAAVMAARWPRCRRTGDILDRSLLWPLLAVYTGVYVSTNVAAFFYEDLGPETIRLLFYVPVVLLPPAIAYVFVTDHAWQSGGSSRRAPLVLVWVTGAVVAYLLVVLPLSGWLAGTPAVLSMLLTLGGLAAMFGTPYAMRRVLQAADHNAYGERARAYRAVRELAERLSSAVSPDVAPRLLCDTVAEALALPAVRVSVMTSEGPRVAALRGEDPQDWWQRFPLTHEDAVIGWLEIGRRTDDHALAPLDAGMLRLLADQAAPSVAFLRLYEDLQASRERIVLAREEARRQIRRDLHDGLAPALSGLRLQLDTVLAALPAEQDVSRQLGKVSHGVAAAIDELRRIVDGLTPDCLDRCGLGAALKELSCNLAGPRLAVAVTLDPDPLPPFPAAVEVALYRIAAEALHNVVRHARADRARLAVRVAGGNVTVEIADDGTGLHALGGGSRGRTGGGLGLRSMTERAAELGGSLTVGPLPDGGHGTLVHAVLPMRGGPTAEGQAAEGLDHDGRAQG